MNEQEHIAYAFNNTIKLSDIDHAKKRAEMYISSRFLTERSGWIFDTSISKFRWVAMQYRPAMWKLIDEVISNSLDEHRRNLDGRSVSNLNRVHVVIKDDEVIVYDDGGIIAEKHPEYNEYLIESYFGSLRSSTNYDDTQSRNSVGVNGVGASLTNIFSKEFTVKSGIYGKSVEITWTNGLTNKSEPIVDLKSKYKGTMVKFKLDFDEHFEGDHFTKDFIDMIHKRCIDAAAANPAATIVFEADSRGYVIEQRTYNFKSFRQYVDLYGFEQDKLIGFKNNDWEFYVVPTDTAVLRVGFVNGAECNIGTHFKHVEYWSHIIMEDHFKKKYKWPELPTREVTGRLAIFINITISNPVYRSQTKEDLITKVDRYFPDGRPLDMGHMKYIRPLLESDLPNMILDWAQRASEAAENKKLRTAAKEMQKQVRVEKLIEANERNDRHLCDLFLFEGDSAIKGFRHCRQPMYQAGYALRGKMLNTLGMKPTRILENKEWRSIISATNLQFGQFNQASLRYGRIIITTDMDYDGISISALILLFFVYHFPDLVRAGMLYRALSPLIIASKRGQEPRHYYSSAEFDADAHNCVGWEVRYIKGLGGLQKDDYQKMLQHPRLERILFDEEAVRSVHVWFGDDSDLRKACMEKVWNAAKFNQITTEQ